jgi:hypothetical protein
VFLSLSFPTESTFALGTLALFSAAILTLVSIVREVLPPQDDETLAALPLSNHFRLDRTRGRFLRYRAIRDSWHQHARLFPSSRKRVLFGALFLGATLSIFVFPLAWCYPDAETLSANQSATFADVPPHPI